jgi:serine/threonine protein kinase
MVTGAGRLLTLADVFVQQRDDWFIAHEAAEVLFDNEIRSPGSDVWSLGTTMWEIMSSGQTPFADESVQGMLDKVCLVVVNAQLMLIV